MFRTVSIAAVIAAMSSSAAFAAMLEYTDSVALQTTDFSATASVSQFDPSLGTLDSVMVTLDSEVVGIGFAESIDNSPTMITLSLGAEVTASLGSTTLVTTFPGGSTVFNASAFDGNVDFGGTSGISNVGLSGSDSDSVTLTTDLAAFIGLGSVDLDVDALGTSTATGAGNIFSGFETDAGATVTVKYTFTEIAAIPLPAGGVLLLGGLAAMAGLRRRKRS